MQDNVYFTPGQTVVLKQDIPNKPKMIVVGKESYLFKNSPIPDKKSSLIGIKCRWFSSTGELQEAVFNTKDLQIVDDNQAAK